jgi:hypothetical protein
MFRLAVTLVLALAPLAAAQASSSAPSAAVTSTEALTSAGFSGGTLTPSARTLPYGTLGLRYDPQLIGVKGRTDGHNAVLGVGLLPYVEVAGRIAAHDLHCNLYLPGDCDGRGWLRDLSASFKAAVPLDAQHRFSVAAGAVDVGGAATNFRTYYGVLGWREGAFDLSVGYGRSDARYGVLTGAFGRMSIRLHESLEVSAERVPAGTWLSARAFAPAAWLPDRWQVYADINHRLGESAVTKPTWFGIGVGIPIDARGFGASSDPKRAGTAGVVQPLFGAAAVTADAAAPPRSDPPRSASPAGSVATPVAPVAPATPATPVTPVTPVTPATPAAAGAPAVAATGAPDIERSGVSAAANPGPRPSAPVDVSALLQLQRALADAGVVDVRVGEQSGPGDAPTLVVRADNGAWRWSDLDAMGIVLARVVRVLSDQDRRLRVVIGRRGVPTLAVEGSVACIAASLRAAETECSAADKARLVASGEPAFAEMLREVRWLDGSGNPSWGRTRIAVAPGLRTGVATEYGVWDYSLAAEVDVEVSLWRGASIDARRTFPISHSADFNDRAVFGPDRHRPITDRVLVHQTVALANGLAARAAYGRIYDDWRGGLGEVRWQPGDGTHRVGAMVGEFRNGGTLRKGFTAEPALVSYRYFVAPLDWSVEVTAGRFFLNDTGWSIASRHWFGDVAVVASVRETRHPNAPAGERFAGLQFELPLTPRRALDRRWVQLQGADRWSYGLETLVGNSHNRITGGHGIVPPVTNSLDTVYDADRAYGAFASRNWARIRDAASLEAAR